MNVNNFLIQSACIFYRLKTLIFNVSCGEFRAERFLNRIKRMCYEKTAGINRYRIWICACPATLLVALQNTSNNKLQFSENLSNFHIIE